MQRSHMFGHTYKCNPYGGMDAHLHLDTLPSAYRALNHDLLRNLNNPLVAYIMHTV